MLDADWGFAGAQPQPGQHHVISKINSDKSKPHMMNLFTPKNRFGFLALLSIAILFGCSSSPTDINSKILLGKYVANHAKGIDEIELKSDDSYKYYFRSKDGREIVNSGNWRLELTENSSSITFSNFIFGLPGYGTKQPGFWIVKVEKTFSGKIKLCLDPDLDYYYIQT